MKPEASRVFKIATLAVLSVFAFFVNAHSRANEENMSSVHVNQNNHKYVLGPYITYLEDKDGGLDVNEVYKRFSENDEKINLNYEDTFNLGLSNSIYWLKIDFRTNLPGDKSEDNWFLELAYPLIKTIDAYFFSKGKLIDYQHAEDTTKYLEKNFYRHFIFKLKPGFFTTESNEKAELLIRVESRALMMIPLILWEGQAFSEHNRLMEYWLGFYFGLMAMMCFYALVVSVNFKDRSYFYFVLYIASSMVLFFTLSGISNRVLAEHSAFWNERAPPVFGFMAMAFILKFSSSFVQLEKFSKRHNQFVNYFFIAMILLSMVSVYKPYEIIIHISLLVSLFFSLFVFYIAVYCYLRGSKSGKVLIAVFTILFICVSMFTFALLTYASMSWVDELGLYIGSALSSLFLSFGLVEQINEERRQRFQALIRENHAVQNLRKLEEKATLSALVDPLTMLPNRAALERFSSEFFDTKDRKVEPLALAFFQIQGYDQVNHSLGFRSGDLLIEKISARLNRSAAEISESIAIRFSPQDKAHAVRIDSNAFVVLLGMKEGKDSCINNIQHLLEILNRPVSVNDMKLEAKSRVGISFLPEHSTNIFTLARFAQAAAESQLEQVNKPVLYSSVIGKEVSRKLRLVSDLRVALQREEFSLVFQPQLDIRNKKIVSIEALIRWPHPEFGELSPDEFIVLAEQAGLIDGLTYWVVDNALDGLTWLIERGVKLRLSVNISARNLSQEDFHTSLLKMLEQRGLKSSVLTLELTETSLMNNPEQGMRILREIHKSGITIAIDDYGAGYSSLSYIKELPISELKIDKRFVKQVDSLHSDRVITKSTIALAHEMGARVCAEGVETAESLTILEQYDCDLVQGFHIAKPMKKEDLLIWVGEYQTT